MIDGVRISHDYHDKIRDRLKKLDITFDERMACVVFLSEICRSLKYESYDCGKDVDEISSILGIEISEARKIIEILENVHAITVIKRGQTKVITVNPEGAYRGDLNHHAEVMDRYKTEVVPLRPDLRPAS
ncbi:hypothetical protein [Pararhodospirillum oryzae]|uniref:Uncharacterized protein n=1 Tax=Pararhodospirillum oryzae TaxID=478448 RepID=A0A512HAW6_9PROT|nr:hypothetical protein [Pararhodospirillum oryzae]GEO82589.1 hypothetical protein ROR02_27200 [Pararhodospirillum oryzae]